MGRRLANWDYTPREEQVILGVRVMEFLRLGGGNEKACRHGGMWIDGEN
jgi:hypothetical protein